MGGEGPQGRRYTNCPLLPRGNKKKKAQKKNSVLIIWVLVEFVATAVTCSCFSVCIGFHIFGLCSLLPISLSKLSAFPNRATLANNEAPTRSEEGRDSLPLYLAFISEGLLPFERHLCLGEGRGTHTPKANTVFALYSDPNVGQIEENRRI